MVGIRSARSELGAGAVEYAVIVALIAVVITGAVSSLGSSLFVDDVEVLGHVLERSELPPDDEVAPVTDVPATPAGGPDCAKLEKAVERNPHCRP